MMPFPSTTFTTLCFIIVSALTTLVSCAPIDIVARDVYIPHITSPTERTTWTCGKNATVTWDNSNLPNKVTNPKGMVVLVTPDGLEHINSPLASGFDVVSSRKITFVVPKVPTGDKYKIVLFGDSGNFSPTFSIVCSTYTA